MSRPRPEAGRAAGPKVLLVTPPFVQPNAPYPATPALTGWLERNGVDVEQRDLGLETALEMLRGSGDDFADEAIEILQNRHLPPEAKMGAAQHLDALALRIRDEEDPDFGFSRYAERLCASLPDFGALLARLRRRTRADRILEARTAAAVADCRPGRGRPFVVGVTCPFPGTLLGAFRIARTVRRLAPEAKIALGGGYVNTELRHLTDRRPFRFFDEILYDEGYAPLLDFVRRAAGAPPGPARGVPPPPVFVKPSYRGLDLSQYFDLPESGNPMHRMWSTGRWIKLQLARGCYWHRCAFCDVSLDYVRRFAAPAAAEVADAMEALAAETGERGFHFTDEAMPPALVKGLCHELIRRRFRCEWWGNVRFDPAWTPAFARLMARAGCVAVTGGLECANDRLLRLMNKGVTRATARAALQAFAGAGILAHAYLMYAFPTETEREAWGALGWVRKLFREGLLQSAYFHRFALTVHSPVAKNPAAFGITLPPAVRELLAGRPPRGLFAVNEIPFREPGAPDWDRIGRGLRLAVSNWVEGRGISRPVGLVTTATSSSSFRWLMTMLNMKRSS